MGGAQYRSWTFKVSCSHGASGHGNGLATGQPEQAGFFALVWSSRDRSSRDTLHICLRITLTEVERNLCRGGTKPFASQSRFVRRIPAHKALCTNFVCGSSARYSLRVTTRALLNVCCGAARAKSARLASSGVRTSPLRQRSKTTDTSCQQNVRPGCGTTSSRAAMGWPPLCYRW